MCYGCGVGDQRSRAHATEGRRASGAQLQLFATAPQGLSRLAAHELRALGASDVRAAPAGVSFHGSLETAYRACLWSRVASRVLLSLASVPAVSRQALYDCVRDLPWEDHLRPTGTLACDFTGTNAAIRNSLFGAQVVKDAVCDRLRELRGARPSVDVRRPDLRLNVHLRDGAAAVAVDLSGDSLHRRGYREPGLQVEAPLKENLAAAVLLEAGWPQLAAAGAWLVDPLCGSGTLPMEAALMAADAAPGLLRGHWGFLGWRGHERAVWAALLTEARERRGAGLSALRPEPGTKPRIIGFDRDMRAIELARAGAVRAGVAEVVSFGRHELADLRAPAGATTGLVITNPPYGRRLVTPAPGALYAALGRRLMDQFPGWRAAIITGGVGAARRLGLAATHTATVYNGALRCQLLQYEIPAKPLGGPRASLPAAGGKPVDGPRPGDEGAAGGEDLANRLRRNLRRLGRPMRRAGVTCYRLYDADLPDYAVAVDLYEDWVHIQEYAAPAHIHPAKAAARLRRAVEIVSQVLDVPPERVVVKVRRRQRGPAQYEVHDRQRRFLTVHEGDAAFLVNLHDYLDTGLFLDQRLTRVLISRLAAGRSFLNLFAYTGSATVCAALGGAVSSTSVDLSATYLDWARRNYALNGLDGARHVVVRADCLDWLEEQVRRRRRYGLVYLDPPTFSNSKRMGLSTFDVQRDHVTVIATAVELLEPDGALLFSTNYRRFRLDQEALAEFDLTDLSQATLPPDFARNARAHHLWRIERRLPAASAPGGLRPTASSAAGRNVPAARKGAGRQPALPSGGQLQLDRRQVRAERLEDRRPDAQLSDLRRADAQPHRRLPVQPRALDLGHLAPGDEHGRMLAQALRLRAQVETGGRGGDADAEPVGHRVVEHHRLVPAGRLRWRRAGLEALRQGRIAAAPGEQA